MFFKKKQNNKYFRLQEEGNLESVQRGTDDEFFEEALALKGKSALEPTKSFVDYIIPTTRLRAGLVFMILGLLILAGKASALQLVQGDEYRALAENNRIREHTLPANRGIIYDRKGTILAQNEPTFYLVTSKAELPIDSVERDSLLTALASFTAVDERGLIDVINETEAFDEPVLLVEDLSYETAMRFITFEEQFPGIGLEVSSRRSYITNQIPSLSHILGYTGVLTESEYADVRGTGYRKFDHIGKQGIEKTYEQELRGTFGEETLEVDAHGTTERIVSKRDAVDGENLYLSIDAGLQARVEEIFKDRMEDTVVKRGSAIVMNPKSGEVYALVSWPAYDANAFTSGIDSETYQALLSDENLPLFPRAFAGEFPSGSTIKPVYAAAALEEKIITPTTTFLSTGGISVGPWFFPDWRGGGHGVTNVYHAIADSVNTFFYIIGGGYGDFEGLGIERLMAYAAKFGFGSPTGIDLPGEASGFLPSKEWKLEAKNEVWYIGDTYHAAIGQGDFLVTPLQIAVSTATIANDGIKMQPHINKDVYPEPVRVIPEETAAIVQDAMRQTVTSGSATSFQSAPVAVAGKTGTAQWASNKPNHSWFTGFAPYEDPSIVVTVLMEEGGDTSLAIPIARDIVSWWFSPENSAENGLTTPE